MINSLECPKCGGKRLSKRSEPIAEDVCEMWFECSKCGWSGDSLNRVETVWGWDKKYEMAAIDCWNENVRGEKQK